MRQQNSSVATLPTSGRSSPAPPRPRWGLRWWAVGVAALAAIGIAAAAVVGSAERDAYLRTHRAVPNLIGKTVAEAARMMVPLHFGILVNGSIQDPLAPIGVVLIQNPPPGRLLPMGSIIQLKASQGSGVVPRLRGDPVSEAARRLELVGLRLGRVRDIEDDAAPGTVLEQFTPPSRRLEPNSPVDVLVSDGPHPDPVVAEPSATRFRATLPVTTAPQTEPSAAPVVGPLAVPPLIDLAPGTLIPVIEEHRSVTPPRGQEGGTRVGPAPTGCAADPERKRTQICHEQANDGGPEPDFHQPEHRVVPAGP
jgi:PASTA domain